MPKLCVPLQRDFPTPPLFINPVLCSSSDLEIFLFFFCFRQMTLKSQPSMEGFATRAEGESDMSDFLESSGGLILTWASPFLWGKSRWLLKKIYSFFFFHSCRHGPCFYWSVFTAGLWWCSSDVFLPGHSGWVSSKRKIVGPVCGKMHMQSLAKECFILWALLCLDYILLWVKWNVWAIAEASSEQISMAALRGPSPSPK